ncbi:MAG TPA: hypothetical protein PKN50_00620 [Spirochaetota bacterium]|nr:hypothetical protein [Spirochaetota bacterium]
MIEQIYGIPRHCLVIKNSGGYLLQSTIETALKLFEGGGKIK